MGGGVSEPPRCQETAHCLALRRTQVRIADGVAPAQRLVLSRLPRLEAQVPIYDGRRFLGRLDLYYRDARLGLEYDGSTHKDSVADDNRRQNLLLGAGVRLLRFTAGDIYNTPDLVVRQVRAALRPS